MFELWFERFDGFGGAWAAWITTATIEALIVLLIVATIWFFIRGRVAPQVGVWLFLLVPLKLLIPIPVPAPALIADWTPASVVAKLTSPQTPEPEPTPPFSEPETFAQPQTVERLVATNEAVLPEVAISQTDVAALLFTETTDMANLAAASNPTATSSSSLNLTTILMFAWAATVGFLGLSFLLREIRFRRRLRSAAHLTNQHLKFDFQTLCKSAGVRRPVRLLRSEAVTAPAVHGILRPSIILPTSALEQLSPAQLRWAVLHELAHIRRHDLALILLQRVVSWLFFFHPAIWISNRIVHQQREFACDDWAILQSESSEHDSRSTVAGEAFLQILRSASERSRSDVALSVLGLGPRKSCQQRLQRMLDMNRRIKGRIGWISSCGLLLTAAVTLPQLSAANAPEPIAEANGAQHEATTIDDETGTWRFTLSVVDTEGKAVPNAIVHLDMVRSSSSPQTLIGKYLNESPDGDTYECNDQGKLSIDFPAKPIRLQVLFRMDGYGRYRALWKDRGQVNQVPQEFTAHVERVKPIRGTVVDEDGNLVKDAEVSVFVKEKNRPGDVSLHGSTIRMKTDNQGRWMCRQFSEVPEYDTNVGVNHRAFQYKRLKIKRSEFEITSSGENQSGGTIKLSKGLTVSGRVVDAKGEPFAGATVRTGAYFDTQRQSITGNDGRYTIVGCRPGKTVVVADSPGMAVETKSVSIEPELKEVDFVLKPSKGIRVRFVDEAGNPLPGLKIFMENWRGKDEVYLKLSHVNKDVDENGFWEWKEAPLDEFSIQIISPLSEWDETPLYQFRHQMSDRMEYFLGPQKLLARQDEYVVTVPKRSVSGTVTDAVTGEKIKSFRLAPGMSQQEERPKNPYWLRSEMRVGFDGTFRIPYTNHVCKKFFFRIDAAGYSSAVSRDIARDEGDVTLDFKLQPAETATTQILDAEGKPAAGSVVVLATGHTTIFIRNGYLNDIDDGLEFKADDQGKVTFTPNSTEPFQLLILHDQGFARVASAKMAVPQQIKLTQWAVLEGKILNGQQPESAARITLDAKGLDSRNGETGAGIRVEYTGTTDSDGNFRFDRVVPGSNSVSQNGGGRKFVAVSGETRKLQVGGTGIPVVGRLLPPKGNDGSLDFKYANLILKSQKLNDDSKESDSGVFFHAVAKSDGSFRMDHIPSGNWVLTSSHQAMVGPDLIKLISDPIKITITPSDQAEKNIGDMIMKVDPKSKPRRMLKQDTGLLRKKNNDITKQAFEEQDLSTNMDQAGNPKKPSTELSASADNREESTGDVYDEAVAGFIEQVGLSESELVPLWLRKHWVEMNDDNEVERVDLNEVDDDEFIAKIAQLPALKTISLASSANLSLNGLAELAKCSALEEVRMTGVGRPANPNAKWTSDAVLEQIAKIPNLRKLTADNCGISDAGLVHLEQATKLQFISLRQNRITDEGMRSLAKLKQLKSLDLGCHVSIAAYGKIQKNDVSDAGIERIASLQQLEFLGVEGLSVSVMELDFPNLRTLTLGTAFSGQSVDDRALENLLRYKKLRSLTVTSNAVTDDGIAFLAELKTLQSLNLHCGSVTDAGVASVSHLPLKSLQLRTVQLTDAGLASISKIKTLNRIDIFGGMEKTTVTGFQQFKNLPNLRTLWLTRFDGSGDRTGFGEIKQLRELFFERADISQWTQTDLDQLGEMLPRASINIGTGANIYRPARNGNEPLVKIPQYEPQNP